MLTQGYKLLEKGCQAVLMKGGHLSDAESPDWLITPEGEWRFTSIRVNTKNTHGTAYFCQRLWLLCALVALIGKKWLRRLKPIYKLR